MANNRLYLKNTMTGKICMLAKSMGNGWYVWDEDEIGERLQQYFDEQQKDFDQMDPAAIGIGAGPTCYIIQDEDNMETR